MTDSNQEARNRHVAKEAEKYARSKALSAAQIVTISCQARQDAMRAALAAGQPIPAADVLSRTSNAALEAARDAALGVRR